MHAAFAARWRSGWCLVAGLVLCVMVCASCRHDTQQPVDEDLIGLFRFTAGSQDTTEIDFGTPQAEPYLGTGWSGPEVAPSGESIVRAVEREAIVSLNFGEPAARVLSVRCRAVQTPTRQPATVTVRLNGRRVADFTAQPEMTEHRIALPAAAQRPGANEIAFCTRVKYGVERLDVAYDALAVLGASGDRQAAPRLEGERTLQLPAPSTVNYFLRLPNSPVMHFGVGNDGGGHGTLRVSVQADDAPAQTVFTGDGARAPRDLPLSAYGGRIVRLAFENGGDTPIELVDPRLRGSERVVPAPRTTRHGEGYNVLLYVIDTLRADHLGCYGYARPTSPQLDAFAHDATVFTHAVAQASWTRPSTASILTGRYPPAHGVTSLRSGLRPGVATLAELLQQYGYRTGAFVTNVNVAPQWGFQRGFELYRYLPEDENSPTVYVGSDVLNAQALEWLDANDGRPFFLYLHATDPHSPYRPPTPWAERLADPTVTIAPERVDAVLTDFRQRDILPTPDEVHALVARYDGAIAFTDDNFGRLLAELRRRGLYERTLIVVVADHGEEFADHGGLEHGRTLYEEMVHVPLIVRAPGTDVPRVRVAELVRQIDVLPTVLDYLAIPGPADLPGRSLLTALAGGTIEPLDAFAETTLGRHQALDAIITGDWKVIRRKTGGAENEQAYDLRADPGEHDDRAADRPVLLGYARQSLAAWAGAATPRQEPAAEPAVDPAIMERLRALGYAD